jgi:hypothetical protein
VAIRADLEALVSLRHALRRLAAAQLDTADAADARLRGARERIDHEIHARARSVSIAEEHVERARYDEDGCYDLGAALAELNDAQADLREAERAAERLEDAAQTFRSARHRFEAWSETGLSRATGFLADRIDALESYLAAELATDVGHAGEIAASKSPLAPLALAAFPALLRQLVGVLPARIGAAGEEMVARLLTTQLGLAEVPFDRARHGFDRVFRAPGVPLIVVEAKVAGDGKLHLASTKDGAQGSDRWVAAKAADMQQRGSELWSPINEGIAALVGAMGSESVPVLAVVVDVERARAHVHQRGQDGRFTLLVGDLPIGQEPEETSG